MAAISSDEELTNVGAKWTPEEDTQLNQLYNIDEKTVTEIALVHKRTISSIISKLIKRKDITKRSAVRGYLEYTQSENYKEICDNKKENSKVKKEVPKVVTATDKNKSKSKSEDPFVNLSAEIQEIKEQLQEILSILNSK